MLVWLAVLSIGVLVGIAIDWAVRKLMAIDAANGACAICAKDATVTSCERCDHKVCSTDSYQLLLPSGINPLTPRPARTICTNCIRPSERDCFKRDPFGTIEGT